MIVTWRVVSILSLVRYTNSECSSVSYYRECWIRRFPGLQVDVEESQRRGAQLLRIYRGDSGQNCSRTCCLTPNFSCNVAVFHYNTTQDSVNCFHLHCPTLQSCTLQQRANVIVYNVTKGMDPDLLIFGKPFSFNAQVLPHLASLNISDFSGTDKRQFNRPQMEPNSSANPTISSTATKHTSSKPTSTFFISSLSDSLTKHNQDKLSGLEIQQSTLNQQSQHISTHNVVNPSTYPTTLSTRSSIKASFGFTNKQTSSMPQPTHTFSTTITPLQLSSQVTPSLTSTSLVHPHRITTAFTISQNALTNINTLPFLYRSPTISSDQTRTTTMLVAFSNTLQSRKGETATIPLPLKMNQQSSVAVTTTMTLPVLNTPQSIAKETTTMPVSQSNIMKSRTKNTPLLTVYQSSTLQRITEKTATKTVPLSSPLQRITENTIAKTVPLSSSLQRITEKTATKTVPLSSILQRITENTIAKTVRLSSTLQRIPENTTSKTVPLSSSLQRITEKTATKTVPLSSPLQRITENTIAKTVPLSSTLQRIPENTTAKTVPLSSTLQRITENTTAKTVPLSSTLQRITENTTAKTVPLLSTLQRITENTTAKTVPLSSTLQRITEKTTTKTVPLSSTLQRITENTIAKIVPLSSTLQRITENTIAKIVPLSSTLQNDREKSTTRTVPVLSIPQTTKVKTTTHTTFARAQLSSASASLSSISTFTPTSTVPQPMTYSFTTTSWSYNQSINTQSSASRTMEKMITPSSTTDRDFQEYTNIKFANPVVTNVTTNRPTTLRTFNLPGATSATKSGLHTSPTTTAILEDSQPYPNDSKGYISRNVTTDNNPQPVSDGGLTQVWHLAANSVLIALATCAALACGCCCSVLMAASWRGRKKRKGRYQTMFKGKKGSMRLIKYVFVREKS